MEVILIKDVENLGYANDIVNVKPGYANNYLIPQGFAKAATASAKKVLAENLRQRAHKDAKILADAQALAEKAYVPLVVPSFYNEYMTSSFLPKNYAGCISLAKVALEG